MLACKAVKEPCVFISFLEPKRSRFLPPIDLLHEKFPHCLISMHFLIHKRSILLYPHLVLDAYLVTDSSTLPHHQTLPHFISSNLFLSALNLRTNIELRVPLTLYESHILTLSVNPFTFSHILNIEPTSTVQPSFDTVKTHSTWDVGIQI